MPSCRSARGTGGTDAVLSALPGVIDHDFASLARWDPLRRRHLTLAGNHPARATAYIEDRLHDDPAFVAVRRSPDGARWWQDVPERVREESPGIREVLRPLGVEGGVAQCLFSADGRYVGVLNVSSVRAGRTADDATRAVLTLLGESLAAVADPLGDPRPGGPGLPSEPGGRSGAVLVPFGDDGAPVPVSGESPPGLTGTGSPLTALVRRAAARRLPPAACLVPYQRRLLELRMTRQSAGILVVCRQVARPAALSAREVEVLAELTRGLEPAP